MKEWILRGERLFLVDYEGRVFGVMAYSNADALRQIRDALWLEFYAAFRFLEEVA